MPVFKDLLLPNKFPKKWMVLLFDALASVISISLAFYFLSFYGLVDTEYAPFLPVSIFTITSVLFFFFFKANELSVTVNGKQPIMRSFDAISGVFVAIMLLNVALKFTGRPAYVPNFVLIIATVLNVLLIGGYRFLSARLQSAPAIAPEIKVLLYGDKALLPEVRSALAATHTTTYRIVGEFEPVTGLSAKDFSFDRLEQMIRSDKPSLVLFYGGAVSNEEKAGVIDRCLAQNVAVKDLQLIKTIEGVAGFTLHPVTVEALLGKKEEHSHDIKVLELVKGRSILITGAAGSIGSELARQIVAMPHARLILCDQNETGMYELEYQLSQLNVSADKPIIYIGDVRDEHSMTNLFTTWQPEIVFHAAAYKHVPMMEANPAEAIRNNVWATKLLVDLSISHRIERFLLVSTDKAINPTNVMGASKRIAEMYVQSVAGEPVLKGVVSKTKFIITRFGNVISSNGSVVPRFREQIAAGGPITVTHPDIIRYFMTISEACALVLDAVTIGKGGEVFRFDMGEPVRIADLAEKMIRLSGFTPGKDMQVTYSGLRPGEKLFEEVLNKEDEELVSIYNSKILVSQLREVDHAAINQAIDVLLAAASQNDDEKVVRQMKRMIPEYISNNSVYQSFDEASGQRVVAAN